MLAGRLNTNDSGWMAIEVSILMAIPIDVLREAASSPSSRVIRFDNIEQFVRLGRSSSPLPSPAERLNKVWQKRGDGPTRIKWLPPTPQKRRVPIASDQSDSDSEHNQGIARDPSYTPGREAMLGKTSKSRDEKERMKCIARDHGACILMGTASPEACHVIPFTVNATEAGRARLLAVRHAFDLIPGSEPARRYKLLAGHLGCSDKS